MNFLSGENVPAAHNQVPSGLYEIVGLSLNQPTDELEDGSTVQLPVSPVLSVMSTETGKILNVEIPQDTYTKIENFVLNPEDTKATA
jgi:hypothetical protein